MVSAPARHRLTARTPRLLLLGATIVLVLVMWRVRAARHAALPTYVPQPGLETRPAAPRPPRLLRLDVGAPTARAALVSGFGPDEQVDGRSVASTNGSRAVVAFELAPDPFAVRVTLRARVAAGGAPEAVALTLNGVPAGGFGVANFWRASAVEVPERLLLSGRNELELAAATPISIDELEVEPLSARAELDPGAPETRRSLEGGWELHDSPSGRAVARLGHLSARVAIRLQPLATDYVLGVSGRADPDDRGPRRITLFVNRVAVGEVALTSAGTSGLALVAQGRLATGENQLELSPLPGPMSTIERLVLEPIGSRAFLDIGTPAARPHLVRGFSVDEAFESGTCAWSDGDASEAIVWLEPESSAYRMTLVAQALPAVAPLAVSVGVNGRALARSLVGQDFASHEWEIPAGFLRRGENRVVLGYAHTAQPRATMTSSADARNLALRIDSLELRPRGP